MKKIIAVLMILSLMIAMVGCGNMSMGFGNYSFAKVHVDSHHYSGCLTIKEWHNNGTGVEVKTKEAGSLFLSEGTYFLIESECPFCGHDEGE